MRGAQNMYFQEAGAASGAGLVQQTVQIVASESKGPGVRSNSNLAIGLKSRPRNCPYTLVARRSGARVIEGREFLNDKDAGRNASEPRSSLVN